MMTNQEILDKAIQKAINSGWDYQEFETPGGNHFRKSHEYYDDNTKEFIADWQERWHCYELIFNHDFTKALWGDTPYHVLAEVNHSNGLWGERAPKNELKDLKKILNWQYHLQQMVIADDPIKYLGENLPT